MRWPLRRRRSVPSFLITSRLSTGAAPLSDELELLAGRLAELVTEVSDGFMDLTDQQQNQVLDRKRLDELVASGATVETWLRGPVEIRAIGHRLNREGGKPLMVEVAERAAALSPDPSTLREIETYWHLIGDWLG